MDNRIFLMMAIPGPLKDGKRNFSIGFELNAKNDVLAVPGTKATDWKNDVLQFTRFLRLGIKYNIFKLVATGVAKPIAFTIAQPGHDAEALRLWATMLGYKFTGSDPA